MASIGNTRSHITSVSKMRCKIVTVDPSQNVIEVAMADGSGRRIAVYDVANDFVWPVVGEDWSICQEGPDWFLRYKYPDDDELEALRSSPPGSNDLIRGFVPGDLKLSARPTLQFGWLQANGGYVRIKDYPALFSAIGHSQTVGVPPGDGTFKLPLMDNDVQDGWVGWIVKT